jgi:glycosyltransferase involved in cell wall biosynthesis
LIQLGIESTLIVADKRSDDGSVQLCDAQSPFAKLRSRFSAYAEAKAASFLMRDSSHYFSPAAFGAYLPLRDERVLKADILTLFWVNGGFMRPGDLAGLAQPIVWRLSDAWPLTGGCHYPGGCAKYESGCGECPQLRTRFMDDTSRRQFRRKAASWRDLDITIAAPSQWIADLAARSGLHHGREIVVIPTGVDVQTFCPRPRDEARHRLGLPLDERIALFGALSPVGDKRKGFEDLCVVLRELTRQQAGTSIRPVVVGAVPEEAKGLLPPQTMYLGYLKEEASLVDAYSAADVVLVLSREDNLPNVALEAIACGTPIVAFGAGGMPDVVHHMHNGYLATPYDAGDVLNGIVWVLENNQRYQQLRSNARSLAEQRFSSELQAKGYLALYQKLLARRNRRGNDDKR